MANSEIKEKKFYGNKVAGVCFIMMFASYGSTSTFAIFLPEFSDGLGVDIVVTAYMASFFGIGGCLGNFIAGKVYEWMKLKYAVILGNLAVVAGYTIYTFSTAIWQNYVGATLVGIGSGIGALSGSAALIQKWFIDRREKLIGLSFAGAGMGACLSMFICGQLIERFNYHIAQGALALFVFIVCIPSILIFVKDPEEVGQKPLGWEREAELIAKAGTKDDVGITFAQALRNPTLYILFIGVVFVGMLILGFETYAPEYWQAYGVSVSTSANYLVVYYGIGCIMTMVSGVVAQKISVKAYIIYINIAFMIGAICCALWPQFQTLGFTLIILICMGIAYPLFTSVPATITTETFGNKDYPKICAILNGALLCGSITYPIVIGWCINAFGTMTAAYVYLVIASVVAIILIVIGLLISPYKKLLKQIDANAMKQS